MSYRHCFEIVAYHTNDGDSICPSCHRSEDDCEGGDNPIFLESVYSDPGYVCADCGAVYDFEQAEWNYKD